MNGRRVRRTRKGDFELRLPDPERELLRGLPDQMRAAFEDVGDPAVERLFPDAYPTDPERAVEWQRLVRDELLASHLAAVGALEEALDAERLDEEQLVGCMKAINQVRLLLGTRLDVTEDRAEREVPDDDPRAPAFALYDYLSWLEEQVVDALGG